ncbi:SGNH/GDSL hydrolase family protein [Lentisphaerota bacterium ZTH]|nr:SGNH/GDSL hydrolase family protein [Lentisphaerota bacterium]WET07326.1 SGNH/GDSL hydrolase family protein [Lentisphaerota bacterium ZTH]
MRKFQLSFLLITLPLITFAKAGINIYIDNQSSQTITVVQKDDKSGKTNKTLTVLPGATVKFNYISTGYLFKLRIKKRLQIFSGGATLGEAAIKVSSAFTDNSFNVYDLEGELAVDNVAMEWQSWYGTPNITVTVFPEKLDLSKSEIFKNVKRVLIFGDSLSDKGTLFEYTQGVIPTAKHYYNGMFSNSDVWAERLKNSLKPFGIEVSNYAVGGATAIFNPDFEHLPYSLAGEFDVFIANAKLKNWKGFNQFLVFTWIGGNDYLTESASLSSQAIENLAGNVVASIKSNTKKLIKKGVSKFVFITLPDLSLVPESKVDLKNTTVTKALSEKHNQNLKDMITELQSQYSDKTFILLDITPQFNSGINNTAEFNRQYGTNITIVNDSCWKGGYTLLKSQQALSKTLPKTADIKSALMVASSGEMRANPENYFFWDRVHPTEPIHKVLFNYFLETLGVSIK